MGATAAAVLALILSAVGALGTWVGSTLIDHEKRVSIIEQTRFTAQDGRELLSEFKADIARDLGGMRSDVLSLRTEVTGLRRDFDRSQTIKQPTSGE